MTTTNHLMTFVMALTLVASTLAVHAEPSRQGVAEGISTLTLYELECEKLPLAAQAILATGDQHVTSVDMKVASEKVAALYLTMGKVKFCEWVKAKLVVALQAKGL